MRLSSVLLILVAVAAAEAVASLIRPDSKAEIAVMGAILMIAAALILLDLTTDAMVASGAPNG